MGMINWIINILLFILLLWTPYSTALVGEETLQLNAYTDFLQFGFAENGYISYKATAYPQQDNVSLYICTDKEFDLLSSYLDPNDNGYCNNPASCEYSGDYRVELDYHVRTKNRYHLILLQCGYKEQVKVQVKYVLLNPGNQQLPLGEIPLPNLYILVTCVWAILMAISMLVWARNKEHVVMLHGLLFSVGVFKLAVVIVALIYWHIYSLSGSDIVQLKYLQSFIYALSETAFFCSLLLISKGWRITRSNLPPSEIRTISVALVLLLSTLLFFSFYNDGYYFLSLMIMYFFMLPKIFTSITRNTRALHTHMLLARYANVELNTEPILAKIRMFKTLRTAVILYLGSILIISSMKIIMWWFLVWVTSCVSECVTIVMVVAVCILTRPRENGVFSPRSYFESGSFPILNMQQFDHFDELFGDQIWDPDLVFGSANLALHNNNNNQPVIDMSEALVIEYPVPQFTKEESNYFPRLAIATLEKDEKEKGKGANDGKDNSGGGGGGYDRRSLRRRGTSSASSSASPSLANSTTALLPMSSSGAFSLSNSVSSSPLLLATPSMPSITYDDLDIDIVVPDSSKRNNDNNNVELVARSTQTSPLPTPSSSSSTTTTTTTTTTSTTPNTPSPVNNRKEYKDNTTPNKPKNNNTNNDEHCNTTTSTSTKTSKPTSSFAKHTPAFNSSTSLLTEDEEAEAEWRKEDVDNEEL